MLFLQVCKSAETDVGRIPTHTFLSDLEICKQVYTISTTPCNK